MASTKRNTQGFLLLNLNPLEILIKVFSLTTSRIDFSTATWLCFLKWSFWKKNIPSWQEILYSLKRSWLAMKKRSVDVLQTEMHIFPKINVSWEIPLISRLKNFGNLFKFRNYESIHPAYCDTAHFTNFF